MKIKFISILIFTLVLLSLSTYQLINLSTLHAALSCDDCHKLNKNIVSGTTYFYGPDYDNVSPNWNSHIAHTSAPFSYKCDICHADTVRYETAGASYTIVYATNHVNGNYTLKAQSSQYNFTYKAGYTVGQSTCSTIACHGGNTAVWGGSVSCYGCHVSTTDLDDYAFLNGKTASISTHSVQGWPALGHGLPSGNYYPSGRPGANFGNNCIYCHDGTNYLHNDTANPFRLANSTQTKYNAFGDPQNGVCLVCHSTVTATGYDPDGAGPLAAINAGLTKSTFTAHWTSTHTVEGSNTDGGKYCWDCHDPHGDWNVAFSTAYFRMFQALPVDLTMGEGGSNYGIPASTQILTRFDFSTGTVKTAWDREDYVSSHTFSFACQTCHDSSVEYFSRSTWTPSADGAIRHSTTTASCTKCHLHKENFEPVGGCVDCHTVAQGNRRAIVPEFRLAWTHMRSSTQPGKVTDRDCAVCHWEAESAVYPKVSIYHNEQSITKDGKTYKGFIDLRNPDNNERITISTATFVRKTSTNTLEFWVTNVQNNFCLKCHDDDGAAHPSARVRSAFQPFDSTGTLSAISSGTASAVGNIFAQFDPTNASAHPVRGSRYNNYCSTETMVAPWGMPGKATYKGKTNLIAGYLISCWDCHIQTNTAHGGAVTLRAAYDRPTNVETKLCVLCHLKTVYWGSTYLTGKSAFDPPSGETDSHPNDGNNRHLLTGDSIGTDGWAGCTSCHGSSYADPGRRKRAENVHGFDTVWISSTTWTTGGARPWGFIRNTAQYSNWRPRIGTGLTAATGGTCAFPGGVAACDPGGEHSASYLYPPGGIYAALPMTTIGDGSPGFDNYYVPAASSTCQVSVFTTYSEISTDTIKSITVECNLYPLLGNVTGVAIYYDANSSNKYEPTIDIPLIGKTTDIWLSSATIKGLNELSTGTVKTYLITYDIKSSSDGAWLNAYVSTVTCKNLLFLQDDSDVTITIDTAPPYNVGFDFLYASSSTIILSSGTASDPVSGLAFPAYTISRSSNNLNWPTTPTTYQAGWVSSHTWTGLLANTTYWFRIKARDNVGNESVWTSTSSKVTWASEPTAVNWGTIYITSVTITWTNNESPANPTNTVYIAYLSTTQGGVDYSSTTLRGATGAGRSLIVSGLTPNTTYYGQLVAQNWEQIGSTVTTLAPELTFANPALNLQVTTRTVTSVDLAWEANANPTYTRYEVSRSTDGFGLNFSTPIALFNNWTSTTATISSLKSNTTYWFRVRAFNEESIATAFSNLVSTKTLIVYIATTFIDDGMPNFSDYYVPGTSNTCQVSVFTILSEISTDTIKSITVAVDTELGSYPLLGNVTGVAIYYDANSSNKYEPTIDTPLIGKTTDVWLSTATIIGLNLATSTQTAKIYLITYDIKSSSDGAPLNAYVSTVTCKNDLVLNDNVDVTLTIDTAPPSAVGFLSPTPEALSYDRIVTSGTASDTTSGLASEPYYIQMSSWSSSFSGTVSTSGWIAVGYQWSSLQTNATYWFRIKARDNVGNESVWTSTSSKVTLAKVPEVAAIPFTDVGKRTIGANWTANTNPSGTMYVCECSTNSGFIPITASSTTFALSALFSGLSPGTTYWFQVKAVNHDNVSTAYKDLGSKFTLSPQIMTAYQDSGAADVPRYRIYPTTGTPFWAAESDANSDAAGDVIQWARLKSSPLKEEKILVIHDAGFDIEVQVYDSTTPWRPVSQFTGTTGAVAYRNFDLAYEQNSGRALVVYSNNAADPQYRIWTSTAWLGPYTFTGLPTSGIPYWIRLEPKANSNEILFASLDANSDIAVAVWNGSSFMTTSTMTVETAAPANTYQCFDIAWQVGTSTGMVAWAVSGSSRPAYRIWNGSTWLAKSTANPTADAAAIRTVRLVSDPSSNRIALGTSDSLSDFNVQVWNGSSFTAITELTAALGSPTIRGWDLAWEVKTSTLMAVYNLNANDGKWKTWSAGTWSGENSLPTIGAVPTWMQLRSDPRTNDIFCGILDSLLDYNIHRWNGSSWGDSTEVGINATATTYECFEVAYSTTEAMVSYEDIAAAGIPRYRLWYPKGIPWGDEFSANTVGQQIYWARLKSSPLKEEKILVIHDAGFDIEVQVYDSTTPWRPVSQFTGTTGAVAYRNFDLAYEQNSGRALVVYSNNAADPQYRIWTSTAWLGPYTFTGLPTTGIPYWIRLEPKANSNEILFASLDANSDIAVAVWNGSSFMAISTTTVETAAVANTYQCFDLAWEAGTGRGMVVWADATAIPKYRIWNGSTWESELSANSPADNAVIRMVRLVSDPSSNRIALGTSDANSDFNVQVWNGSSWDAITELTTALDSSILRGWELAWEKTTSKLVAVYNLNANDGKWQTWSAGTWSGENSLPTIGAVPTWMQLRSDPLTNDIFCGILDSLLDYNIHRWNGSSWVKTGELEDSTSVTTYECFELSFD